MQRSGDERPLHARRGMGGLIQIKALREFRIERRTTPGCEAGAPLTDHELAGLRARPESFA
jgi:hypothetical protein